jgi:hypothetical protein
VLAEALLMPGDTEIPDEYAALRDPRNPGVSFGSPPAKKTSARGGIRQ